MLQELVQKEMSLEWKAGLSREELTDRLAQHINELINQDFQRLVHLLYRVDVNESRLRVLLRENAGADAGRIIANLIIDRQLQKIKTREQYKNKDQSTDAERW